MSSPP